MDKAFNIIEDKMGKKKSNFLEELYLRFQHDRVTELGAQMTYYLILAIFPFLIFLLILPLMVAAVFMLRFLAFDFLARI